MDMIFSDKIRTEDWLAGVYSAIPRPLWGYYKEEGFNTMGDDITIPQEWTPFGWSEVYAYKMGNFTPSSSWLANYWEKLPKKIRSGYIFLDNVRVIEDIDLTEEYVEQMKNEVRFLIAYYYSQLVTMYGPIPFTPGVTFSVDAPSSELMTTQTPFDDIIDWIDKEMKEVSTLLPASYSAEREWGRATSIMALAVRAKTLLMAASPLFNGNPDLEEWKNIDGEKLFNAYDASKWKKAADAHKDLIAAAEDAGYGLYYEYNDDGSIDPFMSYYNMSLKRFSEGNTEIIFGRPEDLFEPNIHWWQGHHLPIGIGGNGGMGVTQELVDAFYMKNGISPISGYNPDGSPIINPASGYVENGFSSEVEVRNTKWKGAEGPDKIEGCVTLDGTYNMYCNREARFYVSVIYNEAWLGVADRRVEFLQDGGRDTRRSFDAPQNGYNVRKRIDLDVFPRNGTYVYQPGIIYRLAEAYLGYAEALNETMSTPSEEVYKYVNLIRERAGIPDLASGLTKEQMREAIQHERRVEFCCEGVRLNDVRRWKLGEKYFDVKMYGMNFNGSEKSDDPDNPLAFYKRTFLKSRHFNKKMYLWPVPQKQIDINPNLVQAPGYE